MLYQKILFSYYLLRHKTIFLCGRIANGRVGKNLATKNDLCNWIQMIDKSRHLNLIQARKMLTACFQVFYISILFFMRFMNKHRHLTFLQCTILWQSNSSRKGVQQMRCAYVFISLLQHWARELYSHGSPFHQKGLERVYTFCFIFISSFMNFPVGN